MFPQNEKKEALTTSVWIELVIRAPLSKLLCDQFPYICETLLNPKCLWA